MKKICIIFIMLLSATVVLASGIKTVSMKAHDREGVTCENCHMSTVVEDGCISCHENSGGTYRGELDKNGIGVEKIYPESGKTKSASIHDSHGGIIRCTVCHTAHIEPKKLYCNNCHQFDVKIK